MARLYNNLQANSKREGYRAQSLNHIRSWFKRYLPHTSMDVAGVKLQICHWLSPLLEEIIIGNRHEVIQSSRSHASATVQLRSDDLDLSSVF
ncbi:hypothetical protein MTR_4g094432 [Medicago truncatula]|uniref:Uncharacterized protein n=1 Tax=Medicago truncatula TaxID=3880 RepID=G8A1D4_MEDTR|nr:hypothetical protein MTR_4g094432 [Medicago truncatula]